MGQSAHASANGRWEGKAHDLLTPPPPGRGFQQLPMKDSENAEETPNVEILSFVLSLLSSSSYGRSVV